MEVTRKEIHELVRCQKKLYTHLVDGDDPDDDETLATFIARHRSKTIATEYNEKTKDDNMDDD
jgi:hypothetical protein